MTTSRISDPRRLDVAAFAAAGGELAGEWPQGELSRLVGAVVSDGSPPAPVGWRARGAREPLQGAGVQPSLRLDARTEVVLECQRCLQPMRVHLEVDRRLFFVDGENAAEALDAESDDDVLAISPSLDLRGLVEDELLLALPLVPRHDACALPLLPGVAETPAEEAAAHPFAGLAALRAKTLPN